MRRTISLIIAAALVFIAAACATPDDKITGASRKAVVDDFMGLVTATSNGEAMPAFKGLALLHNDLFDTETESWANLEFNEGQYVLIEENTSLQISELTDVTKRVEITLTGGKLWVYISNRLSDDESFEIKTPTCALSVRGTVFSVSCDKDGGGRIVVYEGVVNVQAGDESIDLSRGAMEIIAENGELVETHTAALDFEDIAPFYIKGIAGPGGIFAVLREKLPRLTWDNDNPPIDDATNTEPGGNQDGAMTGGGGNSSEHGEKTETDETDPTTTEPPETPDPATTPQPETTAPPDTTPPPSRAPTITFGGGPYSVAAGSSVDVSCTVTNYEQVNYNTRIQDAAGASARGFDLSLIGNAGTITHATIYVDSGVPSATYYVTVTAMNSEGSSSATFALRVVTAVVDPPVISVLRNQSFIVQQGSSLQVRYTITGTEPINVTVDAGYIDGRPGSEFFVVDTSACTITASSWLPAGIYTVGLLAMNSAGSDTDRFTIEVTAALAPPAIFVIRNQNFTVMQGGNCRIQYTLIGDEPIYVTLYAMDVSGAPVSDFFSVDTNSNTVSSSNRLDPGVYTVTLTATNSAGTSNDSFTLVVESVRPNAGP